MGGLNNKDFFLTTLEGESSGQGVVQLHFSQGLSPWLEGGCLLTVSSHGHPSVCVCPNLLSL